MIWINSHDTSNYFWKVCFYNNFIWSLNTSGCKLQKVNTYGLNKKGIIYCFTWVKRPGASVPSCTIRFRCPRTSEIGLSWLCPRPALSSDKNGHQQLWLAFLAYSTEKSIHSSRRRPIKSSPCPGLGHIPSLQPGYIPGWVWGIHGCGILWPSQELEC